MPSFQNGELEAQRWEWMRARSHSELLQNVGAALPGLLCSTAELLWCGLGSTWRGVTDVWAEVRVRTHTVGKTATGGKVRL